MNLDLLAFGAHPDDVEIGMGGTIALHTKNNLQVGICDLTQAELSSNGTVPIRQKESRKASDILNLSHRVNLNIPDRGIAINEESIAKVVDIIRTYRPRVVCAPYYRDRHPDHGHCGHLVKEAVFSAGIKNYHTKQNMNSHRVSHFYYYFINGFHNPDFVIDISDVQDTKMAALSAYKSQFVIGENGVETPLTNGYLETVESRDRLFGKEVNVNFAEGFKSDKPLKLSLL